MYSTILTFAKKINNMVKALSDSVKYIGTDCLKARIFESQYSIPNGISYNSYIILDNKIAVMDTTDQLTEDDWKSNLKDALCERTPNYLVIHHMEPDHSALAAWMLGQYPDLKVVGSAKAIQFLGQFFEGLQLEGRTVTVKEGDVLELGKHSLKFFAAPMVHWPEVMVSFDSSDGTLYSADAFGKFGALEKSGFFTSEDKEWIDEARRYYFNIVGKYGIQVQSLLKKLAGLPVEKVCPLHGPILDKEIEKYIAIYDCWSKYEPETDGIFIAVASIHGGTLAAANEMVSILERKGCKNVLLRDLCRTDMGENVAFAFKYPKMILAAASYDAGLFTPMNEFLRKLSYKGYNSRKIGIIENGSWAPTAAKGIHEILAGMKSITVAENMVSIRSRMKQTDIPAMETLADEMIR